MLSNAIRRLVRAYPSLNLKINVTASRCEVDLVLPGLRFDDLDHTGQPDIWRVFDMLNRVENAAFYSKHSFLEYDMLAKKNMSTIVKACTFDIKSEFYENMTPKAPLDVCIKLTNVGSSTFTTSCEMSCGGKMKPSIKIKNVHTLIDLKSRESTMIPEWWKMRFLTGDLRDNPKVVKVIPETKPASTFEHSLVVPLSDTDITNSTRCSSYLRYFLENASIASNRGHYWNVKTSFHEFHIKKMSMLYFDSSQWGDTLVTESWEGSNPLVLHCNINKEGSLIWYGRLELFPEAYGVPTVKAY